MARSTIMRLAIATGLATVSALAGATLRPQDGVDATTLFRDEIVDAPLRIRMKESALSEETRFAVAASGLSWKAAWNDKPLIISLKGKEPVYNEGVYRLNSFAEARRHRAAKIAFAYAFSVVLDPPEYDATGWKTAFEYLRGYGADLDKALIGVMASPEKMPLLYEYRHAAADVLLYRASPRLLPIYFGMADADDRYIRSRGVVGLGLIGYRTGGAMEETIRGLIPVPRELGISAVQIAMIDEVVRKAAEDKDHRVRAAAAMALGLMGGEESEELLRKMLKDKAYIRGDTGDKTSAMISFPVRAQAARSLERYGDRGINDGSGLYDSKNVGKATRGGQNITNDAREARKKVAHTIRVHDGEW